MYLAQDESGITCTTYLNNLEDKGEITREQADAYFREAEERAWGEAK